MPRKAMQSYAIVGRLSCESTIAVMRVKAEDAGRAVAIFDAHLRNLPHVNTGDTLEIVTVLDTAMGWFVELGEDVVELHRRD